MVLKFIVLECAAAEIVRKFMRRIYLAKFARENLF